MYVFVILSFSCDEKGILKWKLWNISVAFLAWSAAPLFGGRWLCWCICLTRDLCNGAKLLDDYRQDETVSSLFELGRFILSIVNLFFIMTSTMTNNFRIDLFNLSCYLMFSRFEGKTDELEALVHNFWLTGMFVCWHLLKLGLLLFRSCDFRMLLSADECSRLNHECMNLFCGYGYLVLFVLSYRTNSLLSKPSGLFHAGNYRK